MEIIYKEIFDFCAFSLFFLSEMINRVNTHSISDNNLPSIGITFLPVVLQKYVLG